ncbi:hypothetical protein NUACC21_66690 [Scytonema sp. NUACC21]
MAKSALSLLLGLTTTIAVLKPMTVQAADYDYSRVKNLSARPIESNNVLSLYGDWSQNEGYAVFSNLDPDAPDTGRVGNRINATYTSYYAIGRERSPEQSGATRSASLENFTGFNNLFNYLNKNNIPLSSVGFGFAPKNDRDLTKTWNLGENKLGQDWFSSPDSAIEEQLYRANPDDVELFLTYGTTKIINFGYSDFYVISDNSSGVVSDDNWNVFYTDPVPAYKVAGLDPLTSGLADAFLQDVAAGGSVQFVSEDQPKVSDISVAFTDKYQIFNLSFPLEIRVVSSKSVPESSPVLGLLTFGVVGVVPWMTKYKKKGKKSEGMKPC